MEKRKLSEVVKTLGEGLKALSQAVNDLKGAFENLRKEAEGLKQRQEILEKLVNQATAVKQDTRQEIKDNDTWDPSLGPRPKALRRSVTVVAGPDQTFVKERKPH